MQIHANWMQTGRIMDANCMQIDYTIDAICAYEPNVNQKGPREY